MGSAPLFGCTEARHREEPVASATAVEASCKSQIADDRHQATPEQLRHIAEGKAHYRRAEYGQAEQNFRKAVEEADFGQRISSRMALLEGLYGLAASYDQLRRFDLADPIYEHIKVEYGDSATYYNNHGYSLQLRGDKGGAQAAFQKAAALAPGCGITRNNIAALSGN